MAPASLASVIAFTLEVGYAAPNQVPESSPGLRNQVYTAHGLIDAFLVTYRLKLHYESIAQWAVRASFKLTDDAQAAAFGLEVHSPLPDGNSEARVHVR